MVCVFVCVCVCVCCVGVCSGSAALATALLTNCTLTALTLSHNPLRNGGASALATTLASNQSLLTLDLSACKIGDSGMQSVVNSLGSAPKASLRRLRVRDNYVSAACGERVVDGLYHNRSLISCELSGNQIDHVRLQKIRAICKRNWNELKVCAVGGGGCRAADS